MTHIRHRPISLFLTGVALLAAAPAFAQEVVQPLPGTTDADALAAEMRRVASNPRDVDALVDAARLSLRLDDLSGAASLLQRAENVDPRNPRVKAGQAAVLVQSERPGQALRYFAQAEAQGLDAGTFAAERGLAYDLTGQQDHAQRDYARALRDRPDDDETIRRYALSLGISGQRQRAVQLLDPLVRRSDRAAWRAQAFVLAMTGDVGGASRIAATMMPGGAAGLSAFFERLPTLSASDKAFAVHFGDVRTTPERIADARLAPPVTPLSRAPVVLASVQPNRVQRAATAAAPTAAPTPTPGPAPVTYAANAASPPSPRAFPVGLTPYQAPTAQPPARVVAAPTPYAGQSPAAIPSQGATGFLSAAREPSSLVASVAPAPAPGGYAAGTVLPPTPVSPVPATGSPTASVPYTTAAAPAPAGSVATQAGSATPVQTVTLPPSTPATPITRTLPPPPTTTVARGAPQPATAVAARPVSTARATPGTRTNGDAILARIIAGLSIPGSELGVQEPPRAIAAAEQARLTPGRAEPVAVAPDPEAERATAAKAAADRRAADRKAAAEKKALAEKKAAAAKKAIADKEAAEKRRAERANPERIWVQVAGGAYEGDLPKAYAAVKAKAPAVFGSRAGYTTPLRATNRVLTGPFKTDAEARAFVNDLSKAGVSAFTFTSDSGQPVARLGAKGSAAKTVADDDDAPAKKTTSSRGRRRR